MSLTWNVEAKKVIHDLQRQTNKRKSYYNPYKKRFQPIQPRRRKLIPSKLPFFPSETSLWVGDSMTGNPGRGTLRFWIQNCNGLKPHDTSNLHQTFTQIHDYNMHYFSFTESNVNMSNAVSVSRVHRVFKSRFPAGRMAITNCPGFPSTASFQSGGVFSGFTSTLNSRFISVVIDPIGRWICHTFRGKVRDISIYSIDRVHNKTDHSSGLTTAWMQQRSVLRSQNNMTNPRDDIINDISRRVRIDMTPKRELLA